MNEEGQPTKRLEWRRTMPTRKRTQEVIPKKLAAPMDRDAQNEKMEVGAGVLLGELSPGKVSTGTGGT